MQNIYKIKIRSNPDPTSVYPSERRYSASTVLGLSVVHIALALTAVLMASLTFTNYKTPPTTTSTTSSTTTTNTNETRTILKTTLISLDVHPNLSLLSVMPCVMSTGALLAGLTGLLAWKRWYIDRNILWFFCAALLSTLASAVAVFAITLTIIAVYEQYFDHEEHKPHVRVILALNILITCVLELLWSGLSAKIAFAGMTNTYPDDIIVSKGRGRIVVNTVHKGNKKPAAQMVPPDILNHFPNSAKLAKHLPRVTGIDKSGSLPKAESSSEYQERVRRFLSGPSGNDNQQSSSDTLILSNDNAMIDTVDVGRDNVDKTKSKSKQESDKNEK